uniref:TatD related DNase n=1 Tax=Chromera velia CCMP2878 TaxID=1169474 RepID=A0A0G4I4E8_9ALVE|eukprot:Cvel_10900.t1-p1 / transcript=Cvel_10900.t1 / gene=Cvel_10900 / organism=Chromera_velia_CCMP2878 / gene_product=hypothetical protein / transcript_product=hypothetical protein / location=Cvel_scaffold669:7814-9124(-) / protein_length=437 / sequence_SO=supercontig / SO=protein_coding / is_pseudo=false
MVPAAPQKPPPTKPGPSLPIPNDSKDQTGVSQGTIPGDAPPTPIHPPQKLTAPPLPADSAPGPARFPLQFREAAERVKEAADAGVSPLMLCAVSPLSDWSLVECLATERGRGEVVSNFGLHPWWIEPMLRTQQSHSPSASEGSSANDRLLSSLSSHLDLFLRRNLNAGVGECGLDKPHSKRTGTSLDFQTDVLRVHFRKAKEFKRPLTLHCVQAYGRLLDVLQEERKRGAERGSDMSHPCPPSSSASSFQHRESQQEETASSSGCKSASPKAFDVPVILHSFSGPVDLVPRFAEANCFFSVAPFLLRQGVSGGGGGGPSSSPQALKGNKGKGGSVSLSPGASLLRKIPSDRLLLESDCPDGLGRTHLTLGVEEENGGDRESGATLVREVCRRGGENTSALLPLWCETVAKALGVETVALAAQTTSNLRRVLACISRV